MRIFYVLLFKDIIMNTDLRNKCAELLYKNKQEFIQRLLITHNKNLGYYRSGGDYIICSTVVFQLKKILENSYSDLDIYERQEYLDKIDLFFKVIDK